MKKILLTMTAVIITVGAYAQLDQRQPDRPDTAAYQTSINKHPDGFMMKNGKMMCVKDEKMTLLENDTTLTNGTIVMSNGNYTRKGETKMMFKEGQHMDLNGNVVNMTNSNDQVKKMDGKKKMYLVTDNTKNKKNPK